MNTHPSTDERIRKTSLARRLLARPELGAVGGAVAVWIFFALVAGDRGFLTLRGTATYLEVRNLSFIDPISSLACFLICIND